MFAFGDINTIKGRWSAPYRIFQRRTGKTFVPATKPSVGLVVDSKGLIMDCSDDLLQPLGVEKKQIVGQSVRSLIPALPFQPATEGYNIAYATFAAAHKDAKRWLINTADGGRIEATGRIAIHRTAGAYAIRLTIGTLTPRSRVTHREHRPPHSVSVHAESLCISSSGSTGRGSLHVLVPRPVLQMRSDRSGSRVHLMLDSKYRIGFASSTLEELFGIDYEQVVGVPASVLLPDLQRHLGHAANLRSARSRLQKLGPFLSHARHANGHDIPVQVSLQEGVVGRLVALQLDVAIY